MNDIVLQDIKKVLESCSAPDQLARASNKQDLFLLLASRYLNAILRLEGLGVANAYQKADELLEIVKHYGPKATKKEAYEPKSADDVGDTVHGSGVDAAVVDTPPLDSGPDNASS